MFSLIQIVEITTRHSAKIAECCDKVSQRGTLARATEGSQMADFIFIGLIAILAILAIACIGGLLFLKYEETRMARLVRESEANTPYYRDLIPFTSLFDFASLNVSQPKTVKGKL